MTLNNADRLRAIFALYADDDDIVVKWSSGAPESPIGDEIPETVVVKNIDDRHLVTLFALEDGFNTVLAALGTDAKEFKKNWPKAGSKLRVRRSGDTFEIRNATW